MKNKNSNNRINISTDEQSKIIEKTEKFISRASFQHKSPALLIQTKNNTLKKVKHIYPMLSLQNLFNIDDLMSFISRTKKSLNLQNKNLNPNQEYKKDIGIEIVAELKIDGVSFSALYSHGKLIHVATRGDGIVGEDITHNAINILNFPRKINIIEKVEIRGEIYITKENFQLLSNASKYGFSNPRNLASGSIRLVDSETSKMRHLEYFAYHIHGLEYITSQQSILEALEKMGFCVNKHRIISRNIDNIMDFYDDIEKRRGNFPYEIDGIVYKINNILLQNKLGNLSTIPKWAVAHKFSEMEVQTELIKISISVGRKGLITPVAELKPVMLGGVIIKRASLYNKDELERKDIREGDFVIIKRAGDVIPKVVNVVIEKRKPSTKQFIFPTQCPSCNSILIQQNNTVAIKCPNITGCPTMIIESLIHFTSREALNICCLGKKQLKKLFEKGIINTISDIFLIKDYREKILSLNGWGIKSFSNIVNNIEKAKNVSLDKFIFALGIDHIGKTNSVLIAEQCISIHKFRDMITNINLDSNIENVITNIVGIGEKAILSIKEFASNTNNIITLENLVSILNIDNYINDKLVHKININVFSGKTISFTGTLENMERKKAQDIAQTLGAKITNNITKKVNILICGNKAGSKIKKANTLGIEIWNEERWNREIDNIHKVDNIL